MKRRIWRLPELEKDEGHIIETLKKFIAENERYNKGNVYLCGGFLRDKFDSYFKKKILDYQVKNPFSEIRSQKKMKNKTKNETKTKIKGKSKKESEITEFSSIEDREMRVKEIDDFYKIKIFSDLKKYDYNSKKKLEATDHKKKQENEHLFDLWENFEDEDLKEYLEENCVLIKKNAFSEFSIQSKESCDEDFSHIFGNFSKKEFLCKILKTSKSSSNYVKSFVMNESFNSDCEELQNFISSASNFWK